MDDENAVRGGIARNVAIERRVVGQARRLAAKLNGEIEKGNDTAAFAIAVSLALLKDFLDIALDFLGVGLVPGVGFFTGLFLTSFLFFFLLKKGWFLKTKIRVYYWILGFFIDSLPLVNALPMNTLLVLYAWRLTKKRAVNGKLKLKNLNNLTVREIDSLNNDISQLETDSKGGTDASANNNTAGRKGTGHHIHQNGVRLPNKNSALLPLKEASGYRLNTSSSGSGRSSNNISDSGSRSGSSKNTNTVGTTFGSKGAFKNSSSSSGSSSSSFGGSSGGTGESK